MHTNIEELLGKTLVNIEVSEDEIIFTTSENERYKMYHEQDCCESVSVEDIVGDIKDLIGSPLLVAEETNDGGSDEYGDSFAWTFYKFATSKGYVDIRWYGTSNGYYSESVDIIKLEDESN